MSVGEDCVHVTFILVEETGVAAVIVGGPGAEGTIGGKIMAIHSLAASAAECVSGQVPTDVLTQRNLISYISYVTCNESHYACCFLRYYSYTMEC